MEPTNKLTAALIHLSVLTQYFIPFGNFLFPILIWSTTKSKSEFADNHGRHAINFQLSIVLYSIVLCMIAIPALVYSIFKNVPLGQINDEVFENLSIGNLTGIATIAVVAISFFIFLKIVEFFLVIFASVKAANGEMFQYPLTIPFIKKQSVSNLGSNHPEATIQPQP